MAKKRIAVVLLLCLCAFAYAAPGALQAGDISDNPGDLYDGGKAIPAYTITSFFQIGDPTMRIVVDGVPQTFDMGAAPYIKNDRIMVPVRFVGEALMADVFFDETRWSVHFTKPYLSFILYLDVGLIEFQDGEVVYLDSPPENVANRTMMPLGEIADLFGVSRVEGNPDGMLTWDGETQQVTLTIGVYPE